MKIGAGAVRRERGRKILYGKTEIHYELLRMRRKSLEIAVHPDKRVVVKAPASSNIAAIEEKVKKRARWIKRQITYFNQFQPRTPPRQYVGGESHLYLGRQYRLKITRARGAKADNIVLKDGYFFITAHQIKPSYIKILLDEWYQAHARIYFAAVLEECWQKFRKSSRKGNGKDDDNKPALKLQRMSTRWGSLSIRGRLTLNLDLIKAPRECIEYVVIHELCHLVHHHHGAEFYKLLERTMPDWRTRKHKLEMVLL